MALDTGMHANDNSGGNEEEGARVIFLRLIRKGAEQIIFAHDPARPLVLSAVEGSPATESICYFHSEPVGRLSQRFPKLTTLFFKSIALLFILGAHRFGHVLAYPAVAGKAAGRVKHRFPAHH